jgi:hypothetical protein
MNFSPTMIIQNSIGIFQKKINVWLCFNACLELMWRLERKTIYIGSLGAKIILFVQGQSCCVFEPRSYSTNLKVHLEPTHFKIKPLLMQLDENGSMFLKYTFLHMESHALRSL